MSKQTRTHKSIINSLYGIIIVILNTVISFITRIYLIKYLGIEVLGLNGLFTEVIAMMSLAELGVGMAIIYSLYQPLHELNYKKISQLMNLYKTAYNYIALITFLLGLALLPFIHLLITDIDYPNSYIRLIFFIFVLNTTSSYLFSYKTALLNADQKQYITSIIFAIIKLIFTIIIIASIIFTKNYTLYLSILVIQNIISNIVISKYVDKYYPYINYKDKLPKEDRNIIFKNIKNIFIKRLSGVITSSSTNVLISTLVSTVQVGFYSNYISLFSPFKILRNQIANGVTASIGNLSVSETPEKCIIVLKRLTFLFFIYGVATSSFLLGVGDILISLWIGKEYIMPSIIITIAVFNLYIDFTCVPLWQYLEVSGLFKQDRNIAILGSSVNLLVAIIFGIKYGIVGIFMGTVCTQTLQLILKTRLLFKNKYSTSPLTYYYIFFKILLAFIAIVIIQNLFIINISLNNIYLEFLIKSIISIIETIIICSLLFYRSDELSYCLNSLNKHFIRKKNEYIK